MNRIWESVSGDPASICDKLNELQKYCHTITVHTTIPAMDQFQRVTIVSFIELQFRDVTEKEAYITKFKKPSLSKS